MKSFSFVLLNVADSYANNKNKKHERVILWIVILFFNSDVNLRLLSGCYFFRDRPRPSIMSYCITPHAIVNILKKKVILRFSQPAKKTWIVIFLESTNLSFAILMLEISTDN